MTELISYGPGYMSFGAGPDGISRDGRYVVMTSEDPMNAEDTNVFPDAFVYDRQADDVRLASTSPTGAIGNSWSIGAGLSADGRTVAIVTGATNLVEDDSGPQPDLVIRANPVPETTTATPNLVTSGTTTTLTVGGYALDSVSHVAVVPTDDIVVTSITPISNDQLAVDLDVSAAAATGPRSLLLVSGPTGTGTGAATACVNCFSVTAG